MSLPHSLLPAAKYACGQGANRDQENGEQQTRALIYVCVWGGRLALIMYVGGRLALIMCTCRASTPLLGTFRHLGKLLQGQLHGQTLHSCPVATLRTSFQGVLLDLSQGHSKGGSSILPSRNLTLTKGFQFGF